MLLSHEEYEQIERNAPQVTGAEIAANFIEIDTEMRNIGIQSDNGTILIAAAIMEIANVINEHGKEFLRVHLEENA